MNEEESKGGTKRADPGASIALAVHGDFPRGP